VNHVRRRDRIDQDEAVQVGDFVKQALTPPSSVGTR